MQLRPSQQYVPLTFSWKRMVAVRAAWGKSWLWIKTHPWCCPECDHIHTTLESNLLLRAPFPFTTSSSLLANHLLLHSFTYLLKFPHRIDFHQHLSEEGAVDLTVTPCVSQSYTTTLSFPPTMPGTSREQGT